MGIRLVSASRQAERPPSFHQNSRVLKHKNIYCHMFMNLKELSENISKCRKVNVLSQQN